MHKVTRRAFMKVSGVSAAALAMSDRLLVPGRRADRSGRKEEKEEAGVYFLRCLQRHPVLRDQVLQDRQHRDPRGAVARVSHGNPLLQGLRHAAAHVSPPETQVPHETDHAQGLP